MLVSNEGLADLVLSCDVRFQVVNGCVVPTCCSERLVAGDVLKGHTEMTYNMNPCC